MVAMFAIKVKKAKNHLFWIAGSYLYKAESDMFDWSWNQTMIPAGALFFATRSEANRGLNDLRHRYVRNLNLLDFEVVEFVEVGTM